MRRKRRAERKIVQRRCRGEERTNIATATVFHLARASESLVFVFVCVAIFLRLCWFCFVFLPGLSYFAEYSIRFYSVLSFFLAALPLPFGTRLSINKRYRPIIMCSMKKRSTDLCFPHMCHDSKTCNQYTALINSGAKTHRIYIQARRFFGATFEPTILLWWQSSFAIRKLPCHQSDCGLFAHIVCARHCFIPNICK